MRRLCLIAAALLLAVPIWAEELPVMKKMTLELAQKIAQEALTKCRASGYRCSIRVVDEANNEKVFIRDDGASPVTVQAATLKTNTAMLYWRPSGPAENPAPGTPIAPAPIPG